MVRETHNRTHPKRRKKAKKADAKLKMIAGRLLRELERNLPEKKLAQHQEKLALYSDQRDIPSIKGTSGLSPYLAIGVISPRYLLFVLLNQYPDLLTASDSPKFSWLNELIWREFYRHLLFHFPRLSKNQCFKDKYKQTHWHNNLFYFNAWC